MQITIAQTEIEAAIRNYILGQITVRENQRIDIDLRATRGPEGFQAFIDIRPETDPEPTTKADKSETASAAKAEPAKKPPVTASTSGTTKSVFAKTKLEKPVEEPVATNDDKAEPATDETREPANDTVADVPFDVSDTKTEVAADTDATPARSIFSSLRKPVNQAVNA